MTVRQNLPKQSLRKFLFYVILTTSYLRSQTIDVIITYRFFVTLFKQIDFFFPANLTVSTVSTYTRELLECLLGILPSGQNPCEGKKKKKRKKKYMYHLCGLSGQVDYVFNPKQNDLDRY